MDNQLQHWGIKGMRWGVRRYQNKDGSLTGAGKKRYNKSSGSVGETVKSGINNVKAKIAKSKADKAAAEEEAKKLQAQKDAEERAARKERALKSGSAADVMEFKDELTRAQRDEVYSRLQWEQNIRNLEPKHVDAGKARADRIFGKVDDVVGYATSAAKAYNMVANLYNAFSGNKNLLPKIDTNITNGNRDARKKEAKDAKDAADAKNKKTNLDEMSKKNIKDFTDQELNDYIKRAAAENAAKTTHDARKPKDNDSGSSSSDSKNPSGGSGKSNKTEDDKVYTGEVIGNGSSKRSSGSKSKFNRDDAIDVEATPVYDGSNVPAVRGTTAVSNISKSYSSSGKKYTESSSVNETLRKNYEDLAREAKKQSDIVNNIDAGESFINKILKKKDDD